MQKKHHPASTTEQDKGSAEPLSRNIGSHSSIDDKNPDVIPHENSEDDDEKQFERLVLDTDRLKFTPTPVLPPIVKTYSPTHVSPTGNGLKKVCINVDLLLIVLTFIDDIFYSLVW